MEESRKKRIINIVRSHSTDRPNRKREKNLQENRKFIVNADHFIIWLLEELRGVKEEKVVQFFIDIGSINKTRSNVYIFSYAINNPDSFARRLVEVIESSEVEA